MVFLPVLLPGKYGVFASFIAREIRCFCQFYCQGSMVFLPVLLPGKYGVFSGSLLKKCFFSIRWPEKWGIFSSTERKISMVFFQLCDQRTMVFHQCYCHRKMVLVM